MTDAHTPVMRIPVVIAGRPIDTIPLTSEQVFSLQMAESGQIPDGMKLKVLSELFLALMPTDDDRGHLMLSFATNDLTMGDLTETLRRIATADPVDINARPVETVAVVPPRARKAVAKKTAKRA